MTKFKNWIDMMLLQIMMSLIGIGAMIAILVETPIAIIVMILASKKYIKKYGQDFFDGSELIETIKDFIANKEDYHTINVFLNMDMYVVAFSIFIIKKIVDYKLR